MRCLVVKRKIRAGILIVKTCLSMINYVKNVEIFLHTIEWRNNNNMYLEISGRQSGKTERLIQQAVKCLYETQRNIYIIACNRGMVDYIKDRIDRVWKYNIVVVSCASLYHNHHNYGIFRDPINMFFFDEFDFMPDLFGNNARDIGQYNDNYYYATTPKDFNSYATKRLLLMNKGYYLKYTSYYNSYYDKPNEYEWLDELLIL
jgi:hypothetical protein